MAFQATTDVQKPLAAASRITAKGNRIVLEDAASESYIENKASGVRIPLKLERGIYDGDAGDPFFRGRRSDTSVDLRRS